MYQAETLFSITIRTFYLNPFWTINPLTSTLINSEDPHEMPHNAAFHQGMHCLLRKNRSS